MKVKGYWFRTLGPTDGAEHVAQARNEISATAAVAKIGRNERVLAIEIG